MTVPSVISPVARQAADWLRQQVPAGVRLSADSRTIGAGDVFFAYPGETGDGRAHIQSALDAGAAAVVLERTGAEAFDRLLGQARTPSLQVEGLRRRAGEVAAAYLDEPSEGLTVVAVTGTNGKTSCTHWIAAGCNARAQAESGDAGDAGDDDACNDDAGDDDAGTDSDGGVGVLPAAVIGTLGAGFPAQGSGGLQTGPAPARHGHGEAASLRPLLTTPDALELQQQLSVFASQGVELVALEASSIGLQQGRLSGTRIAVAVLTNLTRDHLDYHVTMQAYAAAKARLFAWPTLAAAVVNLEDPASAEMLNAADPDLRRIGYLVNDVPVGSAAALGEKSNGFGDGASAPGLDLDAALAEAGERSAVCTDLLTATPVDDQGRLVLTHFRARPPRVDGTAGYDRRGEGGEAHDEKDDEDDGEEGSEEDEVQSVDLQLSLIGRFNQSNALAVAGVWIALGWSLAEVAVQLEKLEPVPGRLQVVDLADGENLPLAVVDYAHTPDALVNALRALRPLAVRRGGRLWCVFGAGGDRDAGKRAPMAAAAEAHADLLVLTSDNPRSEPPSAILAQLRAGLRRAPHRVEEDRERAIRAAVQAAAPADVVLIAGKGHETYQEIGRKRIAFSDVEKAREALQARAVWARDDAASSGPQPGSEGV